MAKRRVIKRPPAYGYGLNRLLDNVAPNPAPTYSAMDYLKRAIGDADEWWTAQGSAPPPLDLHTTDTPGSAATAALHSGYVTVDPVSLGNLLRGVGSSEGGSLRQRRAALIQLWGIAAHERGHNIGYQHTPDNGLMSDGIKSIPGEGYAWAAEMLPKPRKYKVKRR